MNPMPSASTAPSSIAAGTQSPKRRCSAIVHGEMHTTTM